MPLPLSGLSIPKKNNSRGNPFIKIAVWLNREKQLIDTGYPEL